MGVPALFRWLSKRSPKIVVQVIEDAPVIIPGPDGTFETIPVDTTGPNPNGEEYDNLYLDMNGIVHPCTHPEGKTAPKTEEDMMKEIFLYTDRVVSMVRPRKLLLLAIDGVAPRAKMNQQRSRRFRSAQEARTKEEDRIAAIAEWEAMGKEVSDEFRNEKGWDQNAITPGTPFMTLLASSLRFWIAKKLNEDPGWAGLQVIISDASVPGEGEHKIMDFIRRQRSHPAHDPNTKHVIYGLDADLIMLALATHEPHFKVLREDVFAQDKKGRGCHTCGQMGHHSSQCKGKPKEEKKQGEGDVIQAPTALKPFIFLDVSILREYLAVELSAPIHGFPFELERAIDDWVFLIFFVGNDFLPHLPSLEIREGAVDVLIGIWKASLDKMGGYLTEHGKVNLGRAQLILEGLAMREDEIFRKRREAEERQDKTDKRRKIDAERSAGGPPTANGIDYVQVKPLPPSISTSSTLPSGPSSLPARPNWVETPAAPTPDIAAMVGSNSSVVANRAAIRMANISAAEMFKAELASGSTGETTAVTKNLSAAEKLKKELMGETVEEDTKMEEVETKVEVKEEVKAEGVDGIFMDVVDESVGGVPRGVKRKVDEAVAEETKSEEDDDEDDPAVDAFLAASLIPAVGVPAPAPLKLMGGNVVEQEDTVKLWEPGYKERYYRQKFGIEMGDLEFRNSVVKSYVEGLCWVLEYYFQGTPSWQWYYPHHFSPFASDFTDLENLDIKFTLGAPFKPYEQLMGVFPADSRWNIPEPFHDLMTEDDSPIKDFYPDSFDIDMNGKKMLWQGVALLPFIDPDRLLEAMSTRYPRLTDVEVVRNTLGHDTLFVSQEHPLYDYLEGLYTKRKIKDAVPLDTKRSKGMSGAVLADPVCIPGSTFDSPLPSHPDIPTDKSISAIFTFPSQLTPHRSALLPGVRLAKPVLSSYDKDSVRRGTGGGGGGGGIGNYQGRNNGFHDQRQSGPGFAKVDRGGRGGGGGGGGGPGRGEYTGYGGGPVQGQGGYGGRPQGGYEGGQGQQSRDPYNGYDSRPPPSNNSYGGGAYGGQQQAPPAPYGGYAQQNTYRPMPMQNSYNPPPQQTYGRGGPPPPQRYGAPPQGSYGGYGGPPPPQQAQQPPPFSGYGGYGGNGAQAPPPGWNGHQGGENTRGRGQERRY